MYFNNKILKLKLTNTNMDSNYQSQMHINYNDPYINDINDNENEQKMFYKNNRLSHSCQDIHSINTPQYINEMQQRKDKFFHSKPIKPYYAIIKTPLLNNHNVFKKTPYNVNTSNNHLHNVKNSNSLNLANLRDITEVYCIKKEPTDITDDTIFDRYNNRNYKEYKDLHKEYCDYNKIVMDQVNNERKKIQLNRILQEEDGNVKKRNYYDKMEQQAKMHQTERKKVYRDMLDEQRRSFVMNKLYNENFDIESANINPQYYKEVELSNNNNGIQSMRFDNGSNSNNNNNGSLSSRMRSPDKSFLSRNRFVEVNPYHKKDHYLGETSMGYNTILHPRIDYKYNKYMFPIKSNGGCNQRNVSPFQSVGYSVAH